MSDEDSCEQLAGLVKRQKKLCKRHLELMDSVRAGAQMAIEECQSQFKYRRWNCSTENDKQFGNVIMKQGKLDLIHNTFHAILVYRLGLY